MNFNKIDLEPSRKKTIAQILDVVMAPFAFVVAQCAKYTIVRHSAKFPVCRSLLDRADVALIRHHFYSPAVFPSDIRFPLSQPRRINGIDFNEEAQLTLLGAFDYRDELLEIPLENPVQVNERREYFYRNNAFGVGDENAL